MRKVIVSVESSVDGAFASESPDFWQHIFSAHSADVQTYLSDLITMAGALIMGRETYESFAAVWPDRTGSDADNINAMPKYVASRTIQAPLAWNATLLEGDAADAVTALKQQDGPPLLQYGIGELTHTLLQKGLVDEVRLLVFPFSWGEGTRIFQGMGTRNLHLVGARPFVSGAVLLTYTPRAD